MSRKLSPLRKVRRRINRVAVAAGFLLLDEGDAIAVLAGRFRVGRLVAGMNDHPDFANAARDGFADENAQGRGGAPLAIHQCLQRQRALGGAGAGDDGFVYFHAV
jgi:hypothetical protein